MSAILDKLADQHEERLINVLYTLENDIINSVRKQLLLERLLQQNLQ